jgi:predicted nuclease of restriction endonuclease-like RecB superfamily
MPRKPHSDSTKAKLSAAAAKQNREYVSDHLYCGPKGTLNMRSSWEVKYAKYLDLMGVDWTYEPSFILSNGYVYLPDFQLSTGDIIEIKGYMRPDAQIKWDMFCKEYPCVKKSLLRKDDLKKLGVLRS